MIIMAISCYDYVACRYGYTKLKDDYSYVLREHTSAVRCFRFAKIKP